MLAQEPIRQAQGCRGDPRRGGKTLPGVFRTEGQALNFIRANVVTEKHAVCGRSVSLERSARARYEMKRIDHQQAYSLDSPAIRTNSAESSPAGCVAAKPDIIITSAARTCSLRSRGRVARNLQAGGRTGRRLIGSWRWQCITSPAPISAATGSGSRAAMNRSRDSRLIAKRAELARIVIESGARTSINTGPIWYTYPTRFGYFAPTLIQRLSRRGAATHGRNISGAMNCRGSAWDTLRLAADEPLTAEEITIRIMTAQRARRAGRSPSRCYSRASRCRFEATASSTGRRTVREGNRGDVETITE